MRCGALNALRNKHMNNVLDSIPIGMRYSVINMSDYEKMIFLLSALNCDTLIEEWIPVLLNICSFVYVLYEERKKLQDMLPFE